MAKWLLGLITLNLIFGFGKAHLIRFIIVASLGLAGLWMLHTLAQDFNKIFPNFQKPGPASSPKFFRKRSANDSIYHLRDTTETPEFQGIDWERILLRDPVGCARSFVCQLVASSNDLQGDESNILLLIRSPTQKDNWATQQLQDAIKYGEKTLNPLWCQKRYKFCPYSSKMMMSLLQLFGRL